MLRVVELKNTSNVELPVGTRTIPANGVFVMPYAEYINLAIEYDLSSFPLTVTMPNIEARKVSIRDFGAVGDGLTDDTQAIQDAIDSVSFYGGGVVEVPVGVYIVNGLFIESDITLQGESCNDSAIKLKSGSNTSVVSVSGAIATFRDVFLIGDYVEGD